MGWAFQSLFGIKSLRHFPPLDYNPLSELSPQVLYIHLHAHFLEKWDSVSSLPLFHSVADFQWLLEERRHRTLKGRVKFKTWQEYPEPTLAPLVLPAGTIFNLQCNRTFMLRGREPLWFPCILWVSLAMISQGISNWVPLAKPRLKTIYIFCDITIRLWSVWLLLYLFPPWGARALVVGIGVGRQEAKPRKAPSPAQSHL